MPERQAQQPPRREEAFELLSAIFRDLYRVAKSGEFTLLLTKIEKTDHCSGK